MRVFLFFINAVLWMLLFSVPAGLMGFVSYLVYNLSSHNLFLSIAVALIGALAGFQLAEHVRKKYGLEAFFARFLFTSELG